MPKTHIVLGVHRTGILAGFSALVSIILAGAGMSNVLATQRLIS
jgi:hypothetical protein